MPNPPAGKQATQGPIHNCPCPFCGKPQDFRAAPETPAMSEEIEKGALVECEDCNETYKVTAIETRVIIKLAPP